MEELIDLIRDQKSPWHKEFAWSSNCDAIREAYIKNRRSLKIGTIEKYFTNLRFNNQNIEVIDDSLKRFSNLTDLVLAGNKIRSVEYSNLPTSLKLLDLSGNFLDGEQPIDCNSRLKLQHFGLAFNWIERFRAEAPLCSTLVSLDLSHNQIRHLTVLIDQLVQLRVLKNLVLYGNPIVVSLTFKRFNKTK